MESLTALANIPGPTESPMRGIMSRIRGNHNDDDTNNKDDKDDK